jgi:DNA replication factor GINS
MAMAPGEEMGFKFIQQVQQRESRSHNLTKLPADFFMNLAQHIEGLRQLAREEMARDPMSTTATLLANELRNTLSLTQDIILLRLRKMSNRAVDSLEGGKVDVRALTPGEKDIYGELARFMASAYGQLAPRKGAGGAAHVPFPDTAPPGPSVETEDLDRSPPEIEGVPEAATSPEERPSTSDEAPGPSGAVLIHVLKDTPPFAGEDGQTYSLKKGDMVSLPERLAQVLVSRGMAEEVSGPS